MKVTGFRLQSALRDLELKKQTAQAEFEDSLHFFESEKKVSPEEAMKGYKDAEWKLAQLQELQTRYNLEVMVTVRLNDSRAPLKFSLQHAIKLVGGAARTEKLWRSVTPKKTKRSYYQEDASTVRSKDSEYAKTALTPNQVATQIRETSRFVSSLREAIQVGNSTAVELEVPTNLLD